MADQNEVKNAEAQADPFADIPKADDTKIEIKDVTDRKYVVENIPVDKIVKSELALRDVNTESLEFQQFMDSIKQNGLLNPISVCPIKDQPGMYCIVDGLQRFTAASLLGIKILPCNILTLGEVERLQAQFVANHHTIANSPAQYAKQIQRILSYFPTETIDSVAKFLNISKDYANKLLGLNRIKNERVLKLIDDRTIKAWNAINLSKLPVEEIDNFVEASISDDPNQFAAKVKARIKDIKEDRAKGGKVKAAEFKPVVWIRKTSELKELALQESQKARKQINELVKNLQPADLQQAFLYGIQFACNYDPISQAKQIQDHEEKEKAKKLKQEAAKQERERLKAEKEAAKQEGAIDAAVAATT